MTTDGLQIMTSDTDWECVLLNGGYMICWLDRYEDNVPI